MNVEERRDMPRIELHLTRRCPTHARHAEHRAPLERFALDEKPKVLSRDLDRTFGEPRVLITTKRLLGAKSRVAVAMAGGDVESSAPVFGNREKEVERGLVLTPHAIEGPRRWRRVTVRDVERQTIGEEARGL